MPPIHPRAKWKARKNLHPAWYQGCVQTMSTLRQTWSKPRPAPQMRERGVWSTRSHARTATTPTLVKPRGHKQAVKRGYPRNGIAVHSHKQSHALNWNSAIVKKSVNGYWQRRIMEAIHIKHSGESVNLDNGLQLPTMWNPVLKWQPPSCVTTQVLHYPIYSFRSLFYYWIKCYIYILRHIITYINFIHHPDLSPTYHTPTIMISPSLYTRTSLSPLFSFVTDKRPPWSKRLT